MELSALCDTVRDRLQSKAAGKGIALRIEGEPAAVSGQRRTLEQMIFNLTDNAINYNKPQGSVTLTTGTESGRPFVQVRIPASVSRRRISSACLSGSTAWIKATAR